MGKQSKAVLLARHQAVRELYRKITALNIYKYDYRLKLVAKKTFYSPKRVEEIICMTDDNPIYKPQGYNPDQTNLF